VLRRACAHIVFSSASSLKKALGAQGALSLALRKRRRARQAVESREELAESVASFMRSFEKAERERQREAGARHGQIDDDGFVTVTRRRKGRNNASDGQVTVGAASEAAAAVRAAKRAKRERADANFDFYQFQAHERKREKLEAMRAQFEADKARIAKLRADRKFRPY